jgi:hypothetical protein
MFPPFQIVQWWVSLSASKRWPIFEQFEYIFKMVIDGSTINWIIICSFTVKCQSTVACRQEKNYFFLYSCNYWSLSVNFSRLWHMRDMLNPFYTTKFLALFSNYCLKIWDDIRNLLTSPLNNIFIALYL